MDHTFTNAPTISDLSSGTKYPAPEPHADDKSVAQASMILGAEVERISMELRAAIVCFAAFPMNRTGLWKISCSFFGPPTVPLELGPFVLTDEMLMTLLQSSLKEAARRGLIQGGRVPEPQRTHHA